MSPSLPRRVFMQLLAAAGCNCALAIEEQESKEKQTDLIEVNDEPRVLAITDRVAAFSADGNLLVVQEVDKPPIGRAKYNLLLVNAESGRGIKRLFNEDTPRKAMQSVAISADGKFVAGGSLDHTIKVWDVEQGKQIRTVDGFGSLFVQFSHSGKVLAVGNDASVELWDWKNSERLVRFDPVFSVFMSLSFSADDRWLAASGSTGPVVVYDVQQKKVARSFEKGKDVAACAIAPDGSRVIVVDSRQNAVVWDARNGKEKYTIHEPRLLAYDVAYRSDGKVVALITDEYEIGLFNADDGRRIAKIRDPRKVRNAREGPTLRRLWFISRSRIAAFNANSEVLLWDLPRALQWESNEVSS
jgi:WD40 repeat protein